MVMNRPGFWLCLEAGDRAGATLLGEPSLEGLVEPFDFPAGLGVVGAGVLVVDAEGEQLELDRAAAVAGFGGEDRAVVGQHRCGVVVGQARAPRRRSARPRRTRWRCTTMNTDDVVSAPPIVPTV
jgi:hypothetical protein